MEARYWKYFNILRRDEKMEFAEILLQLIVGSPIIVGTLNIAGLTEIGVNFISKIGRASCRERV